jgi:hypothetical protein
MTAQSTLPVQQRKNAAILKARRCRVVPSQLAPAFLSGHSFMVCGMLALLTGCNTAGEALQNTGRALSPEFAGRLDATTLQRRYETSVADYRACITAKPASACEGQRAIMESNQRNAAAAVRPPVAHAIAPYRDPPPMQHTTCTRMGMFVNCDTF